MFPTWSDWNIQYTKKGLAKKRSRQATKTIALALGIIGGYRLYQSGLSAQDLKEVVGQILRGTLSQAILIWSLVREKLQR